MSTKSNVIELNGKSYDALTGAMLGTAKRPQHRVQVASMPTRQHPRHSSRGILSIDGITVDGVQGPARSMTSKKPASHIIAHQPQPTKTLMRRAVKAPVASPAEPVSAKKLHIQALAPLKSKLPYPSAGLRPNVLFAVMDPSRSRRAAVANRSHLVKHFTALKPQPVNSHQQPRPVSQPVSTLRPQLQRPTYNNDPVVASGISNTSSTHLKKTAASAAALTRPPVKTNAYEDQDIFELALAHASNFPDSPHGNDTSNSAKALRHGKKYHHVLGFVAGLTAFVLMVGFVAYQNKANIELQMASAKAGFSASLPLYKPAGYDLGKLAYGPGAVEMAFKNTASNNAFSVSQKKSNWNSQSLLDNFVAASNQPYQGYSSAGRTIYVYGEGKATWVNGGIWYQIDGAKDLSNEQIVKVAASM